VQRAYYVIYAQEVKEKVFEHLAAIEYLFTVLLACIKGRQRSTDSSCLGSQIKKIDHLGVKCNLHAGRKIIAILKA